MKREGLGFVGGLAADRPIMATLVSAFGLTALAALGANDADEGPAARRAIVDYLIAGGVVVALPFLAASASPLRLRERIAAGLGVIAFAAAVLLFQPAVVSSVPTAFAPAVAAAAACAVILVLAAPMFGAVIRFGFIAGLAALLGMAGGVGLVAVRGLDGSPGAGAVAGLSLALGAIAGLAAIAEFSALFARGAERRQAAGVTAQYGAGPALYMVFCAGAAFAILVAASSLERIAMASIAGACVFLSTAATLLACAGAVSMRHAGEQVAVEENRRRQAFREFWRPIRSIFAPSAANAVVAIAAIAVVAAAFNFAMPVAMSLCLFIIVSAAAAGLIFFSMRAAIFVFFTLLVGGVVTKWIWATFEAPALGPADDAAALALAAALFGQLAVAWRDARSPRLNARETTEAALAESARLYIVSAIVAMAAFFAASLAGVWEGGALAAAEGGVMAVIGLLLAPALMTALSNIGRDFV